jgi:hypothetical protein
MNVENFSNKAQLIEAPIKGPSTLITFLGVEFDTINMELRLPSEKTSKVTIAIRSYTS